jgi:hypothetical protein
MMPMRTWMRRSISRAENGYHRDADVVDRLGTWTSIFVRPHDSTRFELILPGEAPLLRVIAAHGNHVPLLLEYLS